MDTKRAKQGDSISLKIQFSERVSDNTANPSEPKNPPKVKFTLNGISNIVNASMDTGDFTGKNWTATFNTSGWTTPTSQSGDNISFEVYDYWDLNQDDFGYAPNKGIKIKSSNNVKFTIKETNQLLDIKASKDDWVVIYDSFLDNLKISINYDLESDQSSLNPKEDRFNEYFLTGCLNILNSQLKNLEIEVQNTKCEDALNIIQSNFEMRNIFFITP